MCMYVCVCVAASATDCCVYIHETTSNLPSGEHIIIHTHINNHICDHMQI